MKGTLRFHHEMMGLKTLVLYDAIKCSELEVMCKFTPNLETLNCQFTDAISDGSIFEWMGSCVPKLTAVVLEEPEEIKENTSFDFFFLAVT